MTPTGSFAALQRDGYAGKRLGRFEVLCKLGAGGMSEVFLAWQKGVAGFQRAVVLKRILEAVRRQEDFLRMFVKEAKITSSMSHGGIAHLYELSHEDDELFMVMEFVPGATLVEVAKACHLAREPIPIGFTLAVVRDTAQALQYAHTFVDATGRPRSIIHRDVAEKNIMVAFDGTTKLLDFGIARQMGQSPMTQVGTVKGTAGYMSPEQVRGEKLDGRTDVFSLGVVLHECLTGQRLFRRNTLAEEIKALLEAPIPAPSQKNREVTISIDSVVMKALSRDREHRFATSREMWEALESTGGAMLWDKEKRAAFMQRHFARRQADITQMLGDPAATNLDELLPESNGRSTRDDLMTVSKRHPEKPGIEERTVEVLASTGKPPPPVPSPRPPPVSHRRTEPEMVAAAISPVPRRLSGDVQQGYQGIDQKTVTAGGQTDPGNTVEGERTASVRPHVPIDHSDQPTAAEPRPHADPSTMLDDQSLTSDLDSASESDPNTIGLDSSSVVVEPQSGRRPVRTAVRQQQQLLMWIAIASGLVLGLVLAAFLVFG